jgi:hypothetical protein
MGNFHQELGNHCDAITAWLEGLKQIEQFKSERGDGLRYLAYTKIAKEFLNLKDFREALKYLLASIKLAENKTI